MTVLGDTFRGNRTQRRVIFHRVFSVVGLIALSACGYRLLNLPFARYAEAVGSLPYLIFVSVIYITATGLILKRPIDFITSIYKNIFLFSLLFLAMSSILWSPEPDLTLQRAIALTGTMLFAIYLATYLDNDESIKAILWALGLIAVFSLFVIIFYPKIGIHYGDDKHAGKWRGVYEHKNGLGREMALAAIMFFLYRPIEWNRRVCLGIAAICVLLVVFAKSAQGHVLVATMIPAGILLRRLFRLSTPFLCGSLVLMLVGMILLSFMPSVISVTLDMIGRDDTLSSRTILWEKVLEDSLKYHPVLGYGYTAKLRLADPEQWDLHGHAHNGYMQLFSELGAVGILLFSLASLVHWKNAIIRSARYRTMYWQFLIIFSMYFYVLSVVASPILEKNSLLWLLFVYVVLKANDRRTDSVTPSRQSYGFQGAGKHNTGSHRV